MTIPIRVLIVEDHPIYREGLQNALADVPSIDVIAAVATTTEAIAHVDRLRPDLVLLDLTLPDGNGLDLTRQWTRASDGPKVVVLTMTRDPQVALEAIHAGAQGYLVKGSGRADICAAINAAACGQTVFGPEITPHSSGTTWTTIPFPPSAPANGKFSPCSPTVSPTTPSPRD